MSFEYNVESNNVHDTGTTFPKISICSKSMHSLAKLKKHYPGNGGLKLGPDLTSNNLG